MRVPYRLPDQNTICTAQNLSSVPRSPASSSARTSRRVRTTGEVEGFGRSHVWEMAVCTVPSWRWLPFPAVLVVLTSPGPLVRILTMSAVPAESFVAGNVPKSIVHQSPNYTQSTLRWTK
ncbi:hypothetical protein PoMZ_10535 [Pyricularia oryzae]|uniref:Uncharacterized protein n=1 Tax=Pyricularia oryzae TaxID=318829 RepID=A0A4V1C517_PYROR|nr:hypothetical protein PoMZ_10535 [Pyricularia oryzae]